MYQVTINDFEGPLDLLLHLIKKDDIDIIDISVDEITKQYLDYITEIEIIGLDTDFCVLANAMTLKAAFPNVPITIDASCCAGSTPEWHEKALDMLEHCHFNVINRKKE